MSNQQIFRASWHDYRSRCIYMVTVNKRKGIPLFSTLEGDWRLPAGTLGSSTVKLTPIGKVIKDWILRLPLFDPAVKVLQYIVMPDHVHILLFVQRPTTIHLGNTIARFKTSINQNCGMGEIFDIGFNDQILKISRSLDTLYRYIRENARRLAVRRANPDFFRRVERLKIGREECQVYGNLQLLECPFKEQVVIHRADGEEKRRTDRQRWLYTAANRGVLVSPFISPAEKDIRAEAEAAGGRFILIVNEPMDEHYKPTGTDFSLCEAGRMLIVSASFSGSFSRTTCLAMNSLAALISTTTLQCF